MTRKRVYIAHPISKGDLCDNINRATEAFVALAKAGFAPFCPAWSAYSKPAVRLWTPSSRLEDRVHYWKPENVFEPVICEATAMGNDDMSHSDWIGVDLPWVAVSDAVLRLPGESTGADLEVAHAREKGVPVFFDIAELVAHFKENTP